MTEDLIQVYRAVLIQISEDLSVEQYKELLFYCKGHVPRRDLSILTQASSVSCVEIFDRLEDAHIISWENLSFLARFLHVIGRIDLETKLTAFEITRELTMYAWERNGADTASLKTSTTAIGRSLAEMMDLAQDRADVAALICALLQSGMNASNILDAVAKALTGADVETAWNWSALALLVAIAAEIVSVAPNQRVKAGDQPYKYSVKLATELGKYLSMTLTNLGSWDDFCLFVGQRYECLCHQQPELESKPLLSWKLKLADAVKKLKNTIFY